MGKGGEQISTVTGGGEGGEICRSGRVGGIYFIHTHLDSTIADGDGEEDNKDIDAEDDSHVGRKGVAEIGRAHV